MSLHAFVSAEGAALLSAWGTCPRIYGKQRHKRWKCDSHWNQFLCIDERAHNWGAPSAL